MKYIDYKKQLAEAHNISSALYKAGKNDEAHKAWRAFHDKNDARKAEFREKVAEVQARVYKELSYKLSKAQERAVKDLIKEMYRAKLGKDFMNDNYDVFENRPDLVDWCFSNWDKGIYLVTMNTKTLEKIQSLGIIEVVKVGGDTSDHIKPNFDFELTEDERAF